MVLLMVLPTVDTLKKFEGCPSIHAETEPAEVNVIKHFFLSLRRQDTQHNDIQHNNTQNINKNATHSLITHTIMALSILTSSIMVSVIYAECRVFIVLCTVLLP
jgi:hypothetical protein